MDTPTPDYRSNKTNMTHKKISPEEYFHSSGYARAANGERLGASSRETYQMRRDIDRRRRHIDAYDKTAIHRQRLAHYRGAAQSSFAASVNDESTRSHDTSQREAIAKPPQDASGARQQHSFKEPPSRGYNPYA